MDQPTDQRGMLHRAQGCLMGQLAGDALGSLVEFRSADEIRRDYPRGVRKLADGGAFNTLAGQPTDDSEMALMLTRVLIERGTYDADAARRAYLFWLHSGPFDCGNTISAALRGLPTDGSQANGALMRISPLGIFGANYPLQQVGSWAWQDAAITHPNPVCLQANALFAMGISQAVRTGCGAREVYDLMAAEATRMAADALVVNAIADAAKAPPPDYDHQKGWVRTAFWNALYQLLHAPNLEEGVVDTVMRGGDTDTNAAIAGALLGSVYGLDAIPAQWRDGVLQCRPEEGKEGVQHPRPECFWPVHALSLAEKLVAAPTK